MPLLPDVLRGWPPGGWSFFQPETSWGAPDPLQYTFDQQVSNIIAMRKQNPRFKLATDFATVGKELEDFTCARLGNHDKYCQKTDAQKKTSAMFQNQTDQTIPGAAAVGVDPSAVIEWLGDGAVPVASELAEHRASVCAVCDRNSKSPTCPVEERESWTGWITARIAATLKVYSGIKHRMNISTSHDAQLGKCLACRCELTLKVQVPIKHIKENMGPLTIAELAKVKGCWVHAE